MTGPHLRKSCLSLYIPETQLGHGVIDLASRFAVFLIQLKCLEPPLRKTGTANSSLSPQALPKVVVHRY
ncbi:hypothetical protein N7540_004944 [Penicillium herquei]|nr:hypothetical protein N7540_004944 [Penicillium herquei]